MVAPRTPPNDQTARLLAAYGSRGQAWVDAIEMGIDVSLIESGFGESVHDRLVRLQQLLDDQDELRALYGGTPAEHPRADGAAR